MSTHAYPAAARSARLRAAVVRARVAAHADAYALAALGVLVVALLALTWNTWGSVDNDTGYDALAGSRVAGGEFPYVDFVYWYGPLAPLALGLVSLLGGSGFVPAIAFGVVVAVLLLVATYALGRAVAGPAGGLLAGALVAPLAFAPHQFSYVDPHTHSATLGVLTVVAFLLCLHRYAGGASPHWLVAAGIAAGLAGLTRPEFALGALVAAAAWLLLRARRKEGRRRELLALAVPGLGIPVVVYGVFAGIVGVHRLVFENLYPRDFFTAAGNHMLEARTPFTVSSIATLVGNLVLYALGCAALLALAWLAARSDRARRLTLLAFGVALPLVMAVSVARPEALRHGLKLGYAWIPAGAAVALVLLVRGALRRRSSARAEELELSLTNALTIAAAATYAAFYAYSHSPQMAVYALPLAAPFLVGLHLRRLAPTRTAALVGAGWLTFLALAGIGLTLKDGRAESATVHGRGGSIAATPAQAAVYQSAVSWIDASTRRGEPILLAPQLTWLYLVSERTNPLPQLSLLPGALGSVEDERTAIAQLERARVRLVVTEARQLAGYGHTAFGQSFDRVLAGWIHEHFRRAAVLRGPGGTGPALSVWLRRAA